MTEPRTVRQRQVADLMAQGKLDIEIASMLGITRATVRSHRTPKHMSRYVVANKRGRPKSLTS